MDKVIWTNNALSDLNDIAEFIAKDSIKFAQLTIDKLYHRVELLETYPKVGRIVPELEQQQVRELIEGNYRIIYEIYDDIIFILTVHHSAKLLNM